MRILLDNCVNQRFADHMVGKNVVHVRQMGWAELSNGKLMKAAEEAGFDVLLTVDKSVRKQQNMSDRKITLITLDTRAILLESLIPFLEEIEINLAAVEASGHRGQDILIARPTNG